MKILSGALFYLSEVVFAVDLMPSVYLNIPTYNAHATPFDTLVKYD